MAFLSYDTGSYYKTMKYDYLRRFKYLKHRPAVMALQTILVLFFIFDALSLARDVTDQLGRKVAVPANPQRIVSLAPNITEIIFALGQGNRLAGVSLFSDYPDEASDIPRVGSYVCPDLEKIISLRPDLCIAIKDGNPKETAMRLNSMNIPVYAVDPRNLHSVMESILEIGDILSVEQKAKDLVHEMNARIQRVQSAVAQTSHRPGVFCQIGASPIVSVGADTLINELIVIAGGKNLSEGHVSYPRFNREQVLALAPDIIIITSMERGTVFENIREEWNLWPDMPAVKNKSIFLIDSDLFDRAGPRMVDGLELLLEIIHPECFEKVQ